jgi:hypothetical protein
MASVGPAAFPDRLNLLEREPEPELLDLVLQHEEWGMPGYARFVGESFAALLEGMPDLLAGMREIRLVMDDGERVREAAAVLAERLDMPVRMTPAGAEVRVEAGRLVAWREDGPVEWVRILPDVSSDESSDESSGESWDESSGKGEAPQWPPPPQAEAVSAPGSATVAGG